MDRERKRLGYGPGRLCLLLLPLFTFCCLSLPLYPRTLHIPLPSAQFIVMRIKNLDILYVSDFPPCMCL